MLIDLDQRKVSRGGKRISLSPKEFELLVLLASHPGKSYDRQRLLSLIWGYDFESSSRSLDVHVGYLRRKLEAGGHPRMIDTVRGVGFVIRPPS